MYRKKILFLTGNYQWLLYAYLKIYAFFIELLTIIDPCKRNDADITSSNMIRLITYLDKKPSKSSVKRLRNKTICICYDINYYQLCLNCTCIKHICRLILEKILMCRVIHFILMHKVIDITINIITFNKVNNSLKTCFIIVGLSLQHFNTKMLMIYWDGSQLTLPLMTDIVKCYNSVITWLRCCLPDFERIVPAFDRFIPAFDRFILASILVTGQAKHTFINKVLKCFKFDFFFR